MAIDPVCGMTVEPDTAAARFDYQGRTYLFCSKHCLAKFKGEPAKYTGQAKPAASAAAPPGAEYTCPMHPEVLQIGPGSCPKCGMALVPVGGAEEDDAELRDMTRRFWVSAALSLPLVFIAMAPLFGLTQPLGLAPEARSYLEFLLGTPVVVWGGWPFFHKFALSLKNRSPNMYTLIGLGVGVAYAFSLVAVFAPGLFPAEFRMHGGEEVGA
jgi:Cu+-exporting ATPase